MLGLMKTCSKLGVSFFRYLGHRLHVPRAITVISTDWDPRLPAAQVAAIV